ncbi:uncharacterized protein LOC144044811 isoform X2 [Vanacampus margaritifer]
MDALAGLGRNEELKGGQLTAAEELQSATTRRYDNIIGRIGDLTKKCEQYEDASDTMEENVGCMSEAMAKLQASFYMEEFKRDSAAAIMSDHDERGDPRGGTNSKNQARVVRPSGDPRKDQRKERKVKSSNPEPF